nr:apolipoprotein(a)-like isoform X4 [Pseudochaenichthys georgianus]
MDLCKVSFLLGALICSACEPPTIVPELSCYTGEGELYRGTISVTESGKQCQSWSVQTPQKHDFSPDNHPCKGLDSNHCRNPDNERMPWCYTTNTETRWEHCKVPSCGAGPACEPPTIVPELSCVTGEGELYRGTISVTESGKQCQSWSVQTPQKHDFSPDNHPCKGLDSNHCRNPDNDRMPWCYTTNSETRWEHCKVPSCGAGPACEPPTIVPELSCATGEGELYRGTISVTESGKQCQSWSVQTPQKHDFSPDNHPCKGLDSNHCRNPDNERMPWCYTTNTETRWEHCKVPSCGAGPACEPPTIVPELSCATGEGELYRGTISVTESGKQCQSWSVQTPQKHDFSPDNHPCKGLDSNHCRNPDNERMPWCYTTNTETRWEHCKVPSCGAGPACEPPTIVPELICATGEGELYRGTISVTESGKQCQSWSVQTPQKHDFSPDNHPCKGLDGNHCRNPDNERMPWCYTTNTETRWEHCKVPSCGAGPACEPPTIVPELICATGEGELYRGTISVTESGKQCQSWSVQTPQKHDFSPDNHPCKGLDSNHCRNPDNERMPWCYTTNTETRWEHCKVPSCGAGPACEPPTIVPELICATGEGELYRGTISVTESGKQCQSWSVQTPQKHDFSPDNHPCKGLDSNHCRNPDNERMPWCYTTNTETRWEHCKVPSCGAGPACEPPTIVPELSCATGEGELYRGTISVTESGKQCQSWSVQTPQKHDFSPDNHPCKGLDSNHCRNPDNESMPWCYTTNTETRWEHCKVPSCGAGPACEPPTIVPELSCATGEGELYRGTISVTESGKQCQSWSVQTPQKHDFSPNNHPCKGLDSNHCRNPDNERMPWCYTTNTETRWEHCKVPSCGAGPACEPPTIVPELICATGEGELYRGTISVTESGKQCQSWSVQTPQKHDFSPDNHPCKGLDSNHCRNPDNERMPWCYTTNTETRWEHCKVPSCGAGPACEPPTIVPELSCATGEGELYRGTISVTESGKQCQSWSVQTPQKHDFSPDNHPCKGLDSNHCRNPDNERMPWCYTTNTETRWEHCKVPSCGAGPACEPPTIVPELICATGEGELYRGTISVTESGKQCQSWSVQTPQKHDFSPDNHPCKGLDSNHCRNPDNERMPWCYTTNTETRWEHCKVPSCGAGPACEPPTIVPELSCATGEGELYRGTISVTESGKQCQSWSVQTPQKHDFSPDNHPCKGLDSNHCRNPDNDRMPWCYTTNSETRWEHCKVPSCGAGPACEPPTIVPELSCATGEGELYRGTISVTESGKQCQSWSVQTPQKHDFSPDNHPCKGLDSNHCRNPDNERMPWCYTTNTETRWEYCKVPSCGTGLASDPPTIVPELSCATGKGELYRGTISVTESGKQCQSWSVQTPQKHNLSPDNHPSKGLDSNHCRNPDNERMPWCYTTNTETRWEYCKVPSCGAGLASDPPTIVPELSCATGKGELYRGTISVTESGKQCQSWSVQTPQKHNLSPDNHPSKGLDSNHCRNPDNERMPWCYTTNTETRWEYCKVPSCGAGLASDPPTNVPELSCATGKGELYRGTISVTESGKHCQSWSVQTPQKHNLSPDNHPCKGLDSNHCRNPDNDRMPWCYTTSTETRWEYCKVPSCGAGPDCKTGNGNTYRGVTSITLVGVTCQAWSAQSPQQHNSFTPQTHPTKGLEGNSCRNPDGDVNGPWCYTTDRNKKWDYCQIPYCAGMSCGTPVTKPKRCFGRIVGCCVSRPHSWPWQISLRTRSKCPSAYKVLLGVHTKRANEASKQDRNLEKLVLGPNRADIALLKLQTVTVVAPWCVTLRTGTSCRASPPGVSAAPTPQSPASTPESPSLWTGSTQPSKPTKEHPANTQQQQQQQQHRLHKK